MERKWLTAGRQIRWCKGEDPQRRPLLSGPKSQPQMRLRKGFRSGDLFQAALAGHTSLYGISALAEARPLSAGGQEMALCARQKEPPLRSLITRRVLVARSCLRPATPVDRSPSGASAQGILPAGIFEWVACPPPADLPNPGVEPGSPACRWLPYRQSHRGSPEDTRAAAFLIGFLVASGV